MIERAEPKKTGRPAKAPKERKAAERQRNKAAGLVRVELWAHPGDVAEIKRLARMLRERRVAK